MLICQLVCLHAQLSRSTMLVMAVAQLNRLTGPFSCIFVPVYMRRSVIDLLSKSAGGDLPSGCWFWTISGWPMTSQLLPIVTWQGSSWDILKCVLISPKTDHVQLASSDKSPLFTFLNSIRRADEDLSRVPAHAQNIILFQSDWSEYMQG